MFKLAETKITIIGLGYVGLPLAVEFGKKYQTVGFDIVQSRIDELKSGKDSTLEVNAQELSQATQLTYTSAVEDIKASNVYIVTVPTPIDEYKKPDLTPLIKASEMLSKVISKDDVIIYESTVYPGATEDDCVPLLELSNLKFNEDFVVGYSPERVNPGDKEHRVINILKVTSGSTKQCADFVDDLYKSIITAGTYKASSIKIAEAAKVIENTQRDLNIALVNELSMLFNKMNINTEEVLKAAGTKWNFLPFRPGLVGGHCIGVDPYYLTHKAQSLGFHSSLILAGRRTNDGMGVFVVDEVIKLMTKKRIAVVDAKILIMGLTFKENCPDLRNTRVVDMVAELANYPITVDIYDPQVDKEEAKQEYNLKLIDKPKNNDYDAIIIAVSHNEFKEMSIEDIRSFGKKNNIVYDIKYLFDADVVDGRL